MKNAAPENAAEEAVTSPVVGHRSPLSDESVQDAALRHIRLFQTEDSDVRKIYRAADSDDSHAAHDVYEDQHGYIFRTDPRNGRVVQVDRLEDRYTKTRPARPDSRRSVAELRGLATAIAGVHSPNFAKDRSAFHPMEGNRDREMYVFRWEDCREVQSLVDDPPYIEVGLYADGALARFTDALTRPA